MLTPQEIPQNQPKSSVAFIDAGQFRAGVVKQFLKLSDNQKLDWRLFTHLVQASNYYYFDCSPKVPNVMSQKEKFHDFLQSDLKFLLTIVPLKERIRECKSCSAKMEMVEQEGLKIVLAIKAMQLASNKCIDNFYLVSGDADYIPLVNSLRQDFGRKVVVVGWRGGMSKDLEKAANQVIFLEDYANSIISGR